MNRRRTVQQIFEIGSRRFQQLDVRVAPFLLDEVVGVLAGWKNGDVHLESFLDEQLARPRGGALTSRIGIEAEDHL